MVSYLQFRQRFNDHWRKVFGSQPAEVIVIASYSSYLRCGISVEDWCRGFFAYCGAKVEKVDGVVEELSQWIDVPKEQIKEVLWAIAMLRKDTAIWSVIHQIRKDHEEQMRR